MKPSIEEIRMDNGKLPSYGWPGGYPIAYIGEDHQVFCPDCANQEDAEPEIEAYFVNWEDADLYCDGCSGRIESAYAEED